MNNTEKFQTTRFGSYERLNGLPENHDLVSLVLGISGDNRPFGISHAPNLERGMDEYGIALFDGEGDIAWLGVNHNPFSGRAIDDVHGLYSVDRTKKRILYEPDQLIPIRDSYRGFYNRSFGFTGKLVDLLSMIEDSGVPFYQLTPVKNVLLTAKEAGVISNEKAHEFDLAIRKLYQKVTGRDPIPEPFQVEGQITLDKIKSSQLLPVKPLEKSTDLSRYRHSLISSW